MRLHLNLITNFNLSLLFLLFIGCSDIPSVQQRYQTIQPYIKNYHTKVYNINGLKIFSVYELTKNCKNIDVYIEGDGLSYYLGEISNNPTPLNPIGLKLFLKDKNKCKIYFARPCQYTWSKKCSPYLWTEARYGNYIIKIYNQLLNKIKKTQHNKTFILIGYSGGGTIATLIATNRNDIKKIITIASNLDTKKWCNLHYLHQLKKSLNPADFSQKLTKTQQIIILGANDENVNYAVIRSYLNHFKNKKNIKVLIIKNMKHNDKWEIFWEKTQKKFLN